MRKNVLKVLFLVILLSAILSLFTACATEQTSSETIKSSIPVTEQLQDNIPNQSEANKKESIPTVKEETATTEQRKAEVTKPKESTAVKKEANTSNYSTPAPQKSTSNYSTSTPTASIQNKEEKKETIVYITRTGSKYHRAGCRYLSRSQIPISLSDAKSNGYDPCSVCNPPE